MPPDPPFLDPARILPALFDVAVQAVHPRHLIPRTVSIRSDTLSVRAAGAVLDLPLRGRLVLVGAGKGAGAMAEALVSASHGRITRGCVVVPGEASLSIPNVTVVRGEHPVPGPGSLASTRILLDTLSGLKPDDCVLCCLTGGASSLLVDPAPGLTLADLGAVNQALLDCGADIRAMNTIRKHLSRVKGGWLARYARPARVVGPILSDVVGDDLSVIGSGPTVADPTTFADAWRIVEDYGLEDRLPVGVCRYLCEGLAGAQPETPKPGEQTFTRVHNLLIGSNRGALQAAHDAAGRYGVHPHLIDEPLTGDTGRAARGFATTVREIRRRCSKPTCVLAGGETTVRVRGNGKGGRNQEFALQVALELRDEPGWSLLSAGTDGIDGPTDAAGAFVDAAMLGRARTRGINPRTFLSNNDTYTLFSALDDLFRPGPTGTNVMDVKLALVRPRSRVSLRAIDRGNPVSDAE